MSHIKYHTEAIILRSVGTGEADRYLWAVTRDFGRLGFHVRGVRKLSSKQRYCLEPMSYARVSLVRGSRMWRLTNVEEYKKSFKAPAQNVFLSQARIISVLHRLLHGEEKHRDLFDAVVEGLYFFNNSDISDTDPLHLENVIYLRLLFYLGYIEREGEVDGFLTDPADYSREIVLEAMQRKDTLQKKISAALEESGL